MGDRFLERGAPADHRAIEWLRQNAPGRPVVVEAVGGDYTEHARVSTFSGLPTMIGWVGHELQWRGERPGVSDDDSRPSTPSIGRRLARRSAHRRHVSG